ncbi:sugar phosphate isomerase/epimerase family protein [Alkalicoccus daliensis]|uniref:Sugar phosphate isomerase/epimerase n=1 Tax=Alkalicoccus daliensis TaxID=745820 RepID=A0A1H0HK94_9BACI|nr:sugar phosphate isomerase/epimerase [Alkalicoccus daliensis]SDO19626.1 Sugar phosphate isomerase/epimerase [Alkalicoccus daliensis]
MTKIPAAIQLYSLREETEKDFAGTLKKVAALGYQGVEFAGYGGLQASELKKLLEETGLKPAGAHVPLEVLETDLDTVIAYQKEIGNQHIICPFLQEEDRVSKAKYEEIAEKLKHIAARVSEAGLTFSYHNHDFELEEKEGIKPLELLLDVENVNAELDVYWLKKAGEQPTEWLKKYKNKTNLVHLKDMTTDGEQFFAELGTGGIDVKEVIQICETIGVEWLVVEQDVSKIGAMKSAEVSINYLQKHYY